MNEWKISSNYCGGEKFYQVYRTIDETEPDHSGNREVLGTYANKEIAQIAIDVMNKQEVTNEKNRHDRR